ncbi:uncharacterized protein LOC131945081 [Physella acuta]|uniref:uncharacterized protein LOC131945081 n=1 Tax=Physella acuta TaxID=109671 RepID=UPI0027DE0D0A|nr:uncharacterized protein LOC131945081 [Physella acuta]
MKMVSVCTGLTLLLCLLHISSASQVAFVAQPMIIDPILTSTLTLRCSITSPPMSTRQLHVEWPTNPPLSTQVSQVLSVGIFAFDHNINRNQLVASVRTSEHASIEQTYAGLVRVEGSTNTSQTPGEMAYLQVQWDNPLEEQAVSYTCEASMLTLTGQTTSMSNVLEVTSSDPTISDLVKFISQHKQQISDQEKKIALLQEENQHLRQAIISIQSNASHYALDGGAIQQQITVLQQNFSSQTQELRAKVEEMKGQNIESGIAVCHTHYVSFKRRYLVKPTVLTTFVRLGFTTSPNKDTADTFVFQVNTENVDVTGFNVTCINSGYSSIADFVWLAIDN